MILFNGLYFRGSWKIPFSKVNSDVFYRSAAEKKTVPMMKASGTFRTGSLPGLDSEAVELPYEVIKLLLNQLIFKRPFMYIEYLQTL